MTTIILLEWISILHTIYSLQIKVLVHLHKYVFIYELVIITQRTEMLR